MAKLVLTFKGNTIGEFALDKDRILIGRRSQNDICIDNLAVSGEHAAVVSIYNYHFLEDLGSTNGTLVNGREIKKQVLNHNDVIQIGKHELQYINEAIAVGTEFEKTVAIRPQSAPAEEENEDDSEDSGPAPITERGATPYLKLLNGPNSGKRLNLSTASTAIGRQGAQLAVIVRRNGSFYINPGSGKSAPLVNGKGVDIDTPLRDHDVLVIGGTRMEFVLNR
jgi:pSer/pThr/pTyr-binding forkhead associated (FHA) protein